MAIRLEFKSNSKQAQKDIGQLERSVKGIDDNVAKASKSMNSLAKAAKVAAAAFAGIYIGKQLVGIVDSFTLVENRIALVTGRTQELKTTFDELNQISLRARGSIEGIADLYNRLGRTTKQLGVTNDEILEVTETIQKAITISGASAASADAAIVQLGQGLAAGALRGQELNSVMEQTPRVASAIAAELGVGVGQLRKLAEQGKITSEVVVAAFQNQADVINAEFEAVDPTIGGGGAQFAQSFKLVMREFIDATGVTTYLAEGFMSMARSLTAMAPRAEAAGAALRSFFISENKWGILANDVKILGISFFTFEGYLVRAYRAMRDAPSIMTIFNNAFTKKFEQFKTDWYEFSTDTLFERIARAFEGPSMLDTLIKDFMEFEWYIGRLARYLSGGPVTRALMDMQDSFSDMMLSIRISTAKFMAFTIYPMIHGIEMLERAFWWLWDQVVGHSHWPDLIDDINSYTMNIWDSFRQMLGFTGAIENLFLDIKKKIGRQTSKIKEYIEDDLSGDLNIALNAVATLNPKVILATAITFGLQLGGSIVDVLNEEFPRLSQTLAGSLVQALAFFYGKVAFGLVATFGNLLSSGFDVSTIVDALETVVTTLGIGIGKALGGIVSNLPQIAIGLAQLALDFAEAIGAGILEQIPLVGKALKAIPLASTAFGILGLSIFGKAGWKLIRSPKETLKVLFTRISAMKAAYIGKEGAKGSMAQAILGDSFGKLINRAILKVKVFSRYVRMVGKSQSRRDAFGDMVHRWSLSLSELIKKTILWRKGQESFSNRGILVEMGKKIAAHWAGVTAMGAEIASAAGLGAANVQLAFSYSAVAGSMASLRGKLVGIGKQITNVLAILPFGRFVKILAGATGLFGIFGPAVANAADQVKNGTTQINYMNRALFNLFSASNAFSTIGLTVDVDKATAEEATKSMVEINKDLLYKINREAYGAWWNSPTLGIDALKFLGDWEMAFVIAIKNVDKAFSDFIGSQFNDVIELVNYFKDDPIEFRFRTDRSDTTAVEDMLDSLDPTLKLKLDFENKDDIKFVSEESLGDLVGLSATIANYRARIQELTYAEYIQTDVRDAAIKQAQTELATYEKSAQQLTTIIALEAKVGRGIAKIKGTYKSFNSMSASTNELFGEQLIKTLSIRDYLKLTTEEMAKYRGYQADVLELEQKIALVQNNSLLTEENKRRLAAEYVRQLELAADKMNEINKIVPTISRFDAADMFGVSSENMAKVISNYSSEIDGLVAKANRIADIDKRLSENKGMNESEKNRLQLEKLALQQEGDTISAYLEDKLRNPLESMIANLSSAGVTLSRLDLSKMTESFRTQLDSLAISLDKLKQAELQAIKDGSPLMVEATRVAYEKVAAEAARVAEDAGISTFDSLLKPFRDIGSSFSNEDFTQLGLRATKDAMVQAEALSARLKAIQNNDALTKDQMLDKIAQFNADVIEFEEELARQRKDAMFNETKAGEMAGSFSNLLISAMKGETDFAEGFTNLILDSIQNSLQEQIASFAKGFIETMLGGLDSAEKAGSGAAGAVKTMVFGPTEADKQANEGFGAKVAGWFGLGGGGDDSAAAMPTGADGVLSSVYDARGALKIVDIGAVGGIAEGATSLLSGMGSAEDIAATDDTLDMLDGMLGVTDGDRSVIESIGGLTDVSKEGFGGLGGLLGNLFGGGGMGGAMGAIGGIAAIGSAFGLFDNGGSIQPNKFGIVGERGPELVSGPATVYNRAKTARELDAAGRGGNGNVTFALEGDFDSRAERSIRNMVNSGMMQSALNGAEVENGGNQPIFRTP